MMILCLFCFSFFVTWYKDLPFQNKLAIWGVSFGMFAAFLLYKESDERDEYFELIGKSMIAMIPSPPWNKINLILKLGLMLVVAVVYVLELLPAVWRHFQIYQDHIRLFADATLALLIAAAAALLIYGYFAAFNLAFQRIAQTAGYSKEGQIKAVRSVHFEYSGSTACFSQVGFSYRYWSFHLKVDWPGSGHRSKNIGSPWVSHPVKCFTPPRSSLCFRIEWQVAHRLWNGPDQNSSGSPR